MKQYLARTRTVTRGVVNGARSDRITFIAASLAYYAFISLLPLLMLALIAATTFGESELVASLVAGVTDSFGPQAGSLVRDAVSGADGQGGATVVGLVILAWSGLKLFRGLDIAFSEVYGVTGVESLGVQLRDATVALGAVVLGIVATVLIGVSLSILDVGAFFGGTELAGTVGTVTLVLGLTIVFLPLYYFLPGVDISVRSALPGALLAALGWSILQTGFRVYAEYASTYDTYGVLGGVILLVTFLYLGGLILLLGVVFNAVLGGYAEPETGLAEPDEPTPEPTAVLEGTMTQDRLDDDVSDAELREALEGLYDELDRFEEHVDDRTVHRDEIEHDLKRYVRRQVRRGKARGWGPYLVLLYGTAMTLGAFFFLSSGWAVLAMLVIWLSTLGLYVLMLLVGTTVSVASVPGRLKDRFESR